MQFHSKGIYGHSVHAPIFSFFYENVSAHLTSQLSLSQLCRILQISHKNQYVAQSVALIPRGSGGGPPQLRGQRGCPRCPLGWVLQCEHELVAAVSLAAQLRAPQPPQRPSEGAALHCCAEQPLPTAGAVAAAGARARIGGIAGAPATSSSAALSPVRRSCLASLCKAASSKLWLLWEQKSS